MANPNRYYWDACIWIALIRQEEAERAERCEAIIERARKGDAEIWTSSLTLAEAFKVKCGEETKSLQAEKDALFEQYLQQDFVFEVQVDHNIAVTARRLLRANQALKKPNDGIHLATAALYNVDELHTFDGVNLIRLDGLISMRNGNKLKICEPPRATGMQMQLDVTAAAATEVPKSSAESGTTGGPA